MLTELTGELEPGSVDVLFLDALKNEYSDYFRIARPLIAVGGLVLADNVYGTGSGWIDQGHGSDPFNRLIAADPDFEAVAVPLRQGLLIARRLR
jgi:caffeoyl-CoA O-methyltransferase